MSANGGVEVRSASMRIQFAYCGKQHRETLYLEDKALPPTPANIKYARRIATEIRKKISNGEFVYADYFPHSPLAQASLPGVTMLFDVMDDWHELLELKPSTKRQYGTRLTRFWMKHLKNVPVDKVRHSDILKALKCGTWTSGKSRNNELSMIRQVFEFARKDGLISENPCDGIDRAGYQAPKPDPFSLLEAEAIITGLADKHGDQVANFVQFMFFTGLRTSEGIALRWSNIDFIKQEMLIDAAKVYDEESNTTKTYAARKVRLNSRAIEALQRQKAYTFVGGDTVFHDPKTGYPWAYSRITDVRSFWATTLKHLGIRYRRPYNMRHTYATIGLMSGANPGFLAKQLGHSLKMFFSVYADWIDGADNEREMDKIEVMLQRTPSNTGPSLLPNSCSNHV